MLNVKYCQRKCSPKYRFFIFAIILFAAAMQLDSQDSKIDQPESYIKQVEKLAQEGKYNAEETLKLLQDFSAEIKDTKDKSTFIRYQIMLLEMLGRIEEAALLAKTGSDNYSIFSTSLLFYELGHFQASEAEVKKLLLHPEKLDHDLNAKANNLLASIYIITGRNQEAESIFLLLIKRFSDATSAPAFYLNYMEYLFSGGNKEEALEILKILKQRFQGSPEYQLALQVFDTSKSPHISYAPTPARFLASSSAGNAEVQKAEDVLVQEVEMEPELLKVLVQTGSFVDPENAHYMVKDLKDRGFNASIREAVIYEKKYYRVVIGPEQTPEKAQDLLLRLKEKGFEGFLLFPEPKK